MKRIAAAAFLCAAVMTDRVQAGAATGGSAPMAAAAYVVTAPTAHVTLPSNSPVIVQVTDQISSSALHAGSKVNLAVVQDVKVGDTIVIPAGARAEAEISWRTGRGAFGKSGKIEFDLRRIDFAGRSVALSGHYRVEGNGAPLAAAATVVAVGLPGIFVTGHSARIEPGTQFTAYTQESLVVEVSAQTIAKQNAATQRGSHRASGGSVQVNEGRKAGHDDAVVVPM